ncbi:MAG: hypothetical protein R3E65_11240 [Steroidobacteraceae bacterium]
MRQSSEWLVEHRVEIDGLAEIDMHAPELLPQYLHGAQQVEPARFGLPDSSM